MEPITTSKPPAKGRKGSLANPEVVEDVPGHVIPILEREFDDFDNEAEKFLGGETEETEFIGFRLKQGVYGQRQADVQMIRVKLPWGGITPRADGGLRRRRRALRPAQQGAHHDAAEHPDPPRPAARRRRADPRPLGLRPLLARGLRQHRAQRDRRPVGRRVRGTSCSTSPPTRAPTCATSCATPPPSSCRARSRRRSRPPTPTCAITGIHDIGFIPRDAATA